MKIQAQSFFSSAAVGWTLFAGFAVLLVVGLIAAWAYPDFRGSDAWIGLLLGTR